MDSNFDYTETIENYIRGEMSGDQRVQFENQLSQDPLLKEELQIQEDLIHSIKEVRRVELKSRLDGVQVGIFDGITSTTGFKVLATTLITTIIGVGSYYAFFNSGEQPLDGATQEQIAETQTPEVGEIAEKGKKDSKAASKEEKEEAKESDTNSKQTGEKETETASENAEEATTVPASENDANVSTQKPASKQEQSSDQKKEEEKPVDFNPVIPDLDDNFAEEDSTPANDIEVPDNELGPSVVETKTTFEIETKSDTKNQFHYRFKSGKLILFGDFSGSTYEIIELNSTLGKSYYLYYNSNFYPLSVDNTKITELRVLSDKTLIDELKKIKGDN